MEILNKEVYFHTWCPKCKFADKKETRMPCTECLNYPFNTHSHKPVMFKEADK